MDGIADRVAEWLSLGKRLILQSVSKNMSLQLEAELGGKMWLSLEDYSSTLLTNGCE